MTRSLISTTAAALLAAAIAGLSLTAPASAAGQVSLSYTPTDPQEAAALGLGLQFISLAKGMSANGGNISQNGFGNAAGIGQFGSGNHGVLVQQGNGHTGTINQHGNNNSCGLFQFGENTNASCDQYGNGQSSVTTVFGF